MRNFGNFAAFGVLRRTGSSPCGLDFRTSHRPAKTHFVFRPVPSPAGDRPSDQRESMAGNPSSWKYVLNPSRDRVESRSRDGGSTRKACEGLPLTLVQLNSRHGLCFLSG